MTVAQLERAVARLGFAPSIEDGGPLLRDAAARALDELGAARPRLRTVSLWHLPSPPLYAEGSTELIRGEKAFSLPEGRSFFLRVLGRGGLAVTRDGKEVLYPFAAGEDGLPAVLGGELPSGEGALSFRLFGEGGLRLLAFAVYDGSFNGTPPDPFGGRSYDLATLFPSFGGLLSPPTAEDGRTLTEGAAADYTLEDGHLLTLPPHSRGCLRLTYRVRLSLPEEGELPLTEEEAALLPLFCASYVYLDDDPERAAFYLARFREGLARLAADAAAPHPFRDSTKWG